MASCGLVGSNKKNGKCFCSASGVETSRENYDHFMNSTSLPCDRICHLR